MIKRLLILLILLIAVPCWGANIYIDPTAGSGGDGSFATPYDSWTDVDLSVSNNYRQLCGTTYTGTITVTATGTSGDHVIIGAYYDDGGVVHEDDSPNFGQLCGNSAQKPIIKQTLGSGVLITTATSASSQYLEINSLQLKDADTAIRSDANYNFIRYCYLYNLYWGIRVGLATAGHYNTIEYNYIDLNTAVAGDNDTVDAIKLQSYSSNCTVQYNHLTGFDHTGILLSYSDDNTIQYNYIFGSGVEAEQECIAHNFNADRNIIRYNYCNDAGLAHQILGGNDNEIYGNIYSCDGASRPALDQGCIHLQSSVTVAYSSSNNKFYNNTVYDNDNATGGHGVMLYAHSTNNSDVSDNEFYNNIFLKVNGRCIYVLDDNGVIGTNYFYNNACYDFPENQYSYIEGTSDTTAVNFNAGFAIAIDNRGTWNGSPGLSSPSTGEFWPASSASDVYETGYNVGDPYDTLLLSTSNFTASPPSVQTQQFATDYIGAYGLVGAATPLYPIQGAAGNFKYN